MKVSGQKSIIVLLLAVVALLLAMPLRAQNFNPPMGNGQNRQRPIGSSPIPNYDEPEKDTTAAKPPKVRKPLESFYFSDSLRLERTFAWTVSLIDNSITRQVVDTLLPNFQIDYSFMRQDVGDVYLGNMGSATMPKNYFRRPNPQNFSFLSSWSAYAMTPEKVFFYNAKTPYSRLSYSMSGAVQIEENLFDFILSHNISPSTTFNFNYKSEGTKGQYTHQKAFARFFDISFAHTGKRYALHMGYIYNAGEVNENGGIKDDNDFLNPEISSKPRDIPVNLADAQNNYKGNTFWLTQSYGIPLRKQKQEELTIQQIPTVYLGMSAQYDSFGKLYSDRDTQIGTDSTGKAVYYYKNYYRSQESSRDSISQSRVDLKVFAQLQPYNRDGILGLITGGIGNETGNYYSDPVINTMEAKYGTGGSFGRNTTYIYGTAEGAFKKYLRWAGSLKYNLVGYRNTDLTMKGSITTSAYIKNRPLTLDASIEYSLLEPDTWVQNYFSNHFAWANSFTKESSTTISARFSVPSAGLEIGGNYQLVQDKIYYDSLSLPAQAGKPLSVMGIYLQKNFRLGGFHLNHRVLMQWSTQQEVAPVPAASAFLSYFYEFTVVKNVLRLQLGVDGRYDTKYYGFGYNPAIAKYYNQHEKEIGGNPYLDAFAAGKWKRMRILLKLQHFNANLIGPRDYFLALHQPASPMMFKIGVSWSFYD